MINNGTLCKSAGMYIDAEHILTYCNCDRIGVVFLEPGLEFDFAVATILVFDTSIFHCGACSGASVATVPRNDN